MAPSKSHSVGDGAGVPDLTVAPSSQERVAALGVHALALGMAAHYAQLIDEVVSNKEKTVKGLDQKKLLSYRRILHSEETLSILTMIWKESNYVSDRDLEAVNLQRSTSAADQLTSFGLATRLASSPKELAKVNSRIRQIGIAASAFGLIERHQVSPTRVVLKAASSLHEFMLRLAAANERLVYEFNRKISKHSISQPDDHQRQDST